MVDSRMLIVQVVALGVCLWVESLVPLFMRPPQDRLRHGARNLAIGVVNGIVLTVGFSAAVMAAAQWGSVHPLGLLHWLRLPEGAERILGFLAFDLWMYGWHRANHQIPWLWRFHRVHHSDLAVDSTSALRFHVGEMVFSAVLRLAVIPLIGIRLADLVLYELFLEPIVLFHHSNISMPASLDRWLRTIVVTPNMHRVHHSDIPVETNSNYASIFSLWDRLWGTYRLRELATIRYGLTEFREPQWQTVAGLLRMPAA